MSALLLRFAPPAVFSADGCCDSSVSCQQWRPEKFHLRKKDPSFIPVGRNAHQHIGVAHFTTLSFSSPPLLFTSPFLFPFLSFMFASVSVPLLCLLPFASPVLFFFCFYLSFPFRSFSISQFPPFDHFIFSLHFVLFLGVSFPFLSFPFPLIFPYLISHLSSSAFPFFLLCFLSSLPFFPLYFHSFFSISWRNNLYWSHYCQIKWIITINKWNTDG